MAGLATTKGGDNRFHNNIFVGNGAAGDAEAAGGKDPEWKGGYGLWVYDFREFPLRASGNVYLNQARPYCREFDALVSDYPDAGVKLVTEDDRFVLHLNLGVEWQRANTALVTTSYLGKARVPGLPYENADGTRLKIATDYFGSKRSRSHPTPGPFESPGLQSTPLLQVR
jgi:alpha-N-arabinofuranosidase